MTGVQYIFVDWVNSLLHCGGLWDKGLSVGGWLGAGRRAATGLAPDPRTDPDVKPGSLVSWLCVFWESHVFTHNGLISKIGIITETTVQGQD